MSLYRILITTLFAALAVACTEGGDSADADSSQATGEGRAQIRIVGSSTVYPFASYVAEEFGAVTEHSTPVVESTGSGGGMKLFCNGDGLDTPDITNASRRMKVSEFERCRDNGVSDITEAMIGYDGIVVAQARENPDIDLSRAQITLAVAAEVPRDGELVANPYERWSQIDPALPDREILIYGPPTTSGTRDAFEELVMEPATAAMDGFDEAYTRIRQDGLYVPSGENDNLIVQKIEQNRAAFGIFGYSFLEENSDRISAATIGGVAPRPEKISSGEYPVSRSLYFYTKNAHFDRVQGMAAFVEMFMSDAAIGPQGYLNNLGLIPLPEDLRERVRRRVAERVTLEREDL
jgi:phosphate transport system substrate-binding protein